MPSKPEAKTEFFSRDINQTHDPPGMVMHVFNTNTQEAEAGRFLCVQG